VSKKIENLAVYLLNSYFLLLEKIVYGSYKKLKTTR